MLLTFILRLLGAVETTQLGLGLEPMGWDLNPAKTQIGT